MKINQFWKKEYFTETESIIIQIFSPNATQTFIWACSRTGHTIAIAYFIEKIVNIKIIQRLGSKLLMHWFWTSDLPG